MYQYNYLQRLSTYCPEDKYHYTACYLPSFTPLVVNNTVVAVCGPYVCNYYDYIVGNGDSITQDTWCNNKVQCYNGGLDEKYCTVEDEVFLCRDSDGSVRSEISISRACDRKCDCGYCYDEWNCNGYNYHYWYKCNNSSEYIPSYWICNSYASCYHGDGESNCGNATTCIWEGSSTFTYMLTNYSRCTPWVWCTNKLDQTNCSDTTLAPLQCPVGGYNSTVSKHIICKSIVYAARNEHHSNTSAICDDGIRDIRPTDTWPTDTWPTDIRPTDIRPTDIRPTDIWPIFAGGTFCQH